VIGYPRDLPQAATAANGLSGPASIRIWCRMMSTNDSELPTTAIPTVADSAPRLNLVVQKGPQNGTRIPCRRVVTLIGSRGGCKVNLQHRRAAPVHTALVNNGHEIFAVDLLTPEGTKLNGLELQHEKLHDGDVLTVDQWELLVEIEQPDANGNGHADVHPFDLEPTPNLVALEHLVTGRVLQPNRDVCLIGRRNGCDITLPDNSVSRAHALLLTYFGYPAVLDLLTPNGTLVNDAPIQFHTLKDNDVITIGDAQFRARLVGSSVGKRSSNGQKPAAPRVALAEEPVSADLIDIHQTEGAQSWRIADNLERLEKVEQKRRAV